MALNARQQRFVDEYLIDLNATQAAIRAGYSAKTAAQAASRLLTNVEVAAATNRTLARRTEKMEINAESITARLMRIADKAEALKGAGGLSVARQSAMDIAKLNRLIVDIQETQVRDPEERKARLNELRTERERLTRTN